MGVVAHPSQAVKDGWWVDPPEEVQAQARRRQHDDYERLQLEINRLNGAQSFICFTYAALYAQSPSGWNIHSCLRIRIQSHDSVLEFPMNLYY